RPVAVRAGLEPEAAARRNLHGPRGPEGGRGPERLPHLVALLAARPGEGDLAREGRYRSGEPREGVHRLHAVAGEPAARGPRPGRLELRLGERAEEAEEDLLRRSRDADAYRGRR